MAKKTAPVFSISVEHAELRPILEDAARHFRSALTRLQELTARNSGTRLLYADELQAARDAIADIAAIVIDRLDDLEAPVMRRADEAGCHLDRLDLSELHKIVEKERG